MNKRRRLIAIGSAALLAPYLVLAQQSPAKVRRIGYLGAGFASTSQANAKGLLTGLREGTPVEYEIERTGRGPQAVDVVPLA